MRTPATPPDEVLPRGIYLAPYLVKGLPALIAVSSRHWAIKHLTLRPSSNVDWSWHYMEDWLERLDPQPQLRLVTGEEAERIAAAAREREERRRERQAIHPRAYEDHVAFAVRMARQNAWKFRRYD